MVETRRARLVVVVVTEVVLERCVAAARDGVGVVRPTMRRKARRPRKVPQCRATCAIRASKSRAWTKSEEKDSSGGGGGCTTCGGILSTSAAGSGGGGGGGSCIGATTWFGCKDNEHVADCTAAAAAAAAAASSKDNLDSLSEAIQLATLLATRVAAVSSCNVAPHSNRKVLSPNTLSPLSLCKDRTNNDDDDASADDPYTRPE
jgi:hypothetical protein